MGLEPVLTPNLPNRGRFTPCAFARLRLLQWVPAGGRVVKVASTMACTFAGLSCFRRPGLEASRSTPGTPLVKTAVPTNARSSD